MHDKPMIHGVFRTDVRARAAYAEGAGIYRMVPEAVALPADRDDLGTLVRWAEERGTGLTPRGAGSGIPGGSVGSGVVVDLRQLQPRTLEVDPANRTAKASAGVTLAELNAVAETHGLRLPPNPSSGAWATLSGMVATNASGARSVRSGSVRMWIHGLEIVGRGGEVFGTQRAWSDLPKIRPAGPVAEFNQEVAPVLRVNTNLIHARFPRTRKNSSGYALDSWLATGDLVDLFVGSEGTLGFITETIWRLERIPAAQAGLRISLGSLDELEPSVRALMRLRPSAVELLDRTFLELLDLADREIDRPAVPAGTEAMLLVEFERETPEAARGVAGDAVRALDGLALEVETALTPDEERRLWSLRHAASPILASLPPERRSMQVIEDACVPIVRLGEYVRTIRDAAATEKLTVVIFGHAGDGNVHVNVLPNLAEPDWQERVGELYAEVNQAALALGGTLSGEHGDGRLRASWLERQYGPEVVELFQRVKTAFDPHGIFNPGVILSARGSPFDSLKIGPDAALLPEDIALALREIERTGGYAVDRLSIADGT